MPSDREARVADRGSALLARMQEHQYIGAWKNCSAIGSFGSLASINAAISRRNRHRLARRDPFQIGKIGACRKKSGRPAQAGSANGRRLR